MRSLLLSALFLAGCTTAPAQRQVGIPYDRMREDDGTISGSWRAVRRDGRELRDGYQLSIDLAIGTFAVQQGCFGTGGTLTADQPDRYRIGRYETGFAVAEGCPPWHPSAQLAPFDKPMVTIARRGEMLTASADGRTVEFIRLRLR